MGHGASLARQIAALNETHGLGDELAFRAGPSGLVIADVNNTQAAASLCLQGAHLTAWQPHECADPVIWLSEAAQFAPGKAIRGGIPVCWPWFGPHPGDGALPSHGFARTARWRVEETRRRRDGSSEIALTLEDDPATRALWPHAFRLELRVCIGRELRLELGTTNTGAQEFVMSEALHAYFRVGDIDSVQVLGLEGTNYVDSARGGRRSLQQGAVAFEAELDRVYLHAPQQCTIADPTLRRRIRIHQSGGATTVVWNPWQEKAARLGDLGSGRQHRGGWREMLCVESGNALDNAVAMAPGTSHRLSARYQVEA
jgi:D-hexose-6-phosphate mutarotase